MNMPEWVKPGVTGAVIGGIATMVVGFSQGGWYLGSSAETLAQERSAAAVVEALVPICIDQSRSDPQAVAKLDGFGAATTSYARRDFVIDAGWATMPSTDAPNRAVATACAEALASAG